MSKKIKFEDMDDDDEDNFVSTKVTRCYEGHKPLKITVDGKTYKVWGGSCYSPVKKDADIYIGFAGAPSAGSGYKYPWEAGYKAPVLIDYPITDMQPPKNVESFKEMVKWTGGKVLDGFEIHGGCAGGHGRTGTWLAALYASLTGKKDAIEYVRKNYCTHAVESNSQVEFLVKHYGVNRVEGYKETAAYKSTRAPTSQIPAWSVGGTKRSDAWLKSGPAFVGSRKPIYDPPILPLDERNSMKEKFSITPNHSQILSMWGPHVAFDKLGKSDIIVK